jgi:hypothetical protein
MYVKKIFYTVAFSFAAGLIFLNLDEEISTIVSKPVSSVMIDNSTNTHADTQSIADDNVKNSDGKSQEEGLADATDINEEKLTSENLEKDFDRLQNLDEVIGNGNIELIALIQNYDQNIGDKVAEKKLSSALLSNEEYRLSLIEKFKLERDLKN